MIKNEKTEPQTLSKKATFTKHNRENCCLVRPSSVEPSLTPGPVLSHDLGQGEVWGPGGGRPAERWRGLMPEHRVEAFSHLCCRLVWHAADRCPGITVTTVLTFFGNVPSGGADWSPRRYLYNGSFLEMHEI